MADALEIVSWIVGPAGLVAGGVALVKKAAEVYKTRTTATSREEIKRLDVDQEALRILGRMVNTQTERIDSLEERLQSERADCKEQIEALSKKLDGCQEHHAALSAEYAQQVKELHRQVIRLSNHLRGSDE